MNLKGKSIQHKTFGPGTVLSVKDNVIEVRFSLNEKKFVFPQAFKGFLTLQDPSAQQQISAMLTQIAHDEQAQKLAAQEEQERMQRLQNFKISPVSQAVFALKHNTREDVFSSWRVCTGQYLSGCAKGMPRTPSKLKPNSACLITDCAKGAPEQDRKIVGAFMVKDDFFGDFCTDGIIPGHEQYRISLTDAEALPYWDYCLDADQLPKWGNTEFKYFANELMQRILLDIRGHIHDTERRTQVMAFYQYFCSLNDLSSGL